MGREEKVLRHNPFGDKADVNMFVFQFDALLIPANETCEIVSLDKFDPFVSY